MADDAGGLTCPVCRYATTEGFLVGSECPNCGAAVGSPPQPVVDVGGGVRVRELDVDLLGRVREGVRALVTMAGGDPDAEGLVETPDRVVRSYMELTAGYDEDPAEILATTFDGGPIAYDELVVMRRLRFVSVCEHHLLPFEGWATVGYLPGAGGRVVGISKLARLVDCFARRFQIQERLTVQVAQALLDHLGAAGSGCIVVARHGCLSCRGVRRPDAEVVTSALFGRVREDARLRQELLALAGL